MNCNYKKFTFSRTNEAERWKSEKNKPQAN